MEILEILNQDNYLMYNLNLARECGVNSAILVGEIARKYNYWKLKSRLTDDGFFFISQEDLEKDTGLSPYQQRDAYKRLVEVGLLIVEKRGMPSTNHYKLLSDKLLDFLVIKKSSDKETSRLVVKKLDATNTINTNTINSYIYKENENDVNETNAADAALLADNKSNNKSISKKYNKYGTYENILLTDDEYNKLKLDYSNDIDRYISEMSNYLAANGKTYKNYAAALRNWAARDYNKLKNNTYKRPDNINASTVKKELKVVPF